jgi:glutathione reductase (NADPH)
VQVTKYDLVAIGTGTAATVAASRCRAAGWRVAVIDHLPFGGTCALRGCDPKKVLVGAVEAIDHARRMRGKGVARVSSIAWRELMQFKRTFTESVPVMMERSFSGKGIDTYHGRARFRDAGTLAVEGEELEFRFALVAAGAVPVRLGIPGEEHVITSTEFLELDELPKRIALIGGGYIAAEFSHIAARAGAQVTVLQRAERILKSFDADLVGWLMEGFNNAGIDTRLNTHVERVEKRSSGFGIRGTSEGNSQTFDADLVVHAAGRVPDLEPLDLAAAGVDVEHGHIKLNGFLQSESNPAVYAAGDAASSGPPLTPVAAHDGHVVAHNMLKGNQRRPDYLGIPSVAFSIPAIAAVGLGESQAREAGFRFHVRKQKASDWYTARRLAEPIYGFKVLVEEKTERLLGAHLVGPHADEVINVFALAIRNNLTATALKDAIFAYPTGASDIGYML